MENRPQKFLENREFLHWLKQIELFLKPSTGKLRSGIHPLSHRGQSIEFSEYQPYRPGADIKNLDWKVYARTDRYYVRIRDSHSPATVLIVLDNSSSMNVGSPNAFFTKYQASLLLAFALGRLLHQQGDAFSFHLLFSKPKYSLPPSTSRKHWTWFTQQLIQEFQHGATPSNPTFDAYWPPQTYDHVFVISDGMVPTVEWQAWMTKCQYTGHHVSFYRIIDPLEISPPQTTSELQDAEAPTKYRTVSPQAWEHYKQNFEHHAHTLQQYCFQHGMTYHQWIIDTPPWPTLHRLCIESVLPQRTQN